MTRYARHLQDVTINNPFPGLPRLEALIGRKIVSRIGSNESMAIEQHTVSRLWGDALYELARLYPDPYATAVRERAATLNGVTAANVVVDAGADSLIALFLRTRVSPGDVVVCTAGSYPTFRYFAEGVGARIVEVPYAETEGVLHNDLPALARAAREHDAALLYLANPDNPTGTFHRADAIDTLQSQLPADCLLLLDEAYIDFCAEGERQGVLPNTARLRTLSKAHGLAGLRVGYAIAPEEWIAKADQIRTQFAVSSVAQAAATAALNDPDCSARLIADTLQLRDQLASALLQRGLQILPSHTNFVAIVYPDAATALAKQKTLLSQGVAVHRPPHPSMQHVLRVTAHPDALQATVLAALCQA
ncbi:aminotransferase class I/II-fold pyridoxal phosphate-dependent enzyme [Vogesella oryzae]|uniref:aminotransferase class I/II-fold pyridoxal phosphate-dependent enzyme n=1 Tax=Vogesella oryzae TaxID=1735285 RepID=UPI001583FCC1|nr:aminotransferase class I/II-fold pyridoxal phosphate-dependent enzyme [Vogesella oryzae]